jgi:hypothetical protein
MKAFKSVGNDGSAIVGGKDDADFGGFSVHVRFAP